MAHFIGLYYPFIHFRDEAWLMTVALYWDRVKRIVPEHYKLQDSDTVKALTEQLGLIENEAPSIDDEWPVREDFVKFVIANTPTLIDKYGLKNRPLG
jgi:hypothetical protein